MTNIILCGGSGTRLWPISRTLMPKQFVKLFDDRSLFQMTVERNATLCQKQFIVSNQEQYFLVLDQLEEMGNKEARYLLEPVGRNTAPAIALACMALDPEKIVLVTPSDHLIKNQAAYHEAVQSAKRLASENHLVTFGITPDYPETGFGYIEADGEDVKSFKEKRDLETAKSYLEQGNYYWNSGMFCFKAGIFLQELQKHAPEIYESCVIAFENRKIQNATLRIQYSQMETIPSESIDYAVIEKSKSVKVILSDIDWSDLGSFDVPYQKLPKDTNGNTQNNKHISIDSKNNLFLLHDKQITTIIDIDDKEVRDLENGIISIYETEFEKIVLENYERGTLDIMTDIAYALARSIVC